MKKVIFSLFVILMCLGVGEVGSNYIASDELQPGPYVNEPKEDGRS